MAEQWENPQSDAERDRPDADDLRSIADEGEDELAEETDDEDLDEEEDDDSATF